MNQQAIINLLLKKTGNNPVVNNAMNMLQNGNGSGVEQLARNLCQTKGVNPDEALHKAKQMFGIK